MLNVGGSVDLFVEDAVDMTHGEVHDYLIDMDGVSSSAFEGDMKVGDKPGHQEGEKRGEGRQGTTHQGGPGCGHACYSCFPRGWFGSEILDTTSTLLFSAARVLRSADKTASQHHKIRNILVHSR